MQKRFVETDRRGLAILAMVTLVAPIFRDHSMFVMRESVTGGQSCRYFFQFLSVLEATVTNPSFARAHSRR